MLTAISMILRVLTYGIWYHTRQINAKTKEKLLRSTVYVLLVSETVRQEASLQTKRFTINYSSYHLHLSVAAVVR